MLRYPPQDMHAFRRALLGAPGPGLGSPVPMLARYMENALRPDDGNSRMIVAATQALSCAASVMSDQEEEEEEEGDIALYQEDRKFDEEEGGRNRGVYDDDDDSRSDTSDELQRDDEEQVLCAELSSRLTPYFPAVVERIMAVADQAGASMTTGDRLRYLSQTEKTQAMQVQAEAFESLGAWVKTVGAVSPGHLTVLVRAIAERLDRLTMTINADCHDAAATLPPQSQGTPGRNWNHRGALPPAATTGHYYDEEAGRTAATTRLQHGDQDDQKMEDGQEEKGGESDESDEAGSRYGYDYDAAVARVACALSTLMLETLRRLEAVLPVSLPLIGAVDDEAISGDGSSSQKRFGGSRKITTIAPGIVQLPWSHFEVASHCIATAVDMAWGAISRSLDIATTITAAAAATTITAAGEASPAAATIHDYNVLYHEAVCRHLINIGTLHAIAGRFRPMQEQQQHEPLHHGGKTTQAVAPPRAPPGAKAKLPLSSRVMGAALMPFAGHPNEAVQQTAVVVMRQVLGLGY